MNWSLTGPAMAAAASNNVQSVLLAIRALGREPVIVQFLQAPPPRPAMRSCCRCACVKADELRRMRSSRFNLVRRRLRTAARCEGHEQLRKLRAHGFIDHDYGRRTGDSRRFGRVSRPC